jgi:hypothetical protein
MRPRGNVCGKFAMGWLTQARNLDAFLGKAARMAHIRDAFFASCNFFANQNKPMI